ncbi:N/A [soil metagenome]
MAKVLVVDDTPSIRFLIRTNLELAGFDVVEAADGDECLRLVSTERPDLITIDAVMPHRDGFSAVRALRADAGTASLPIVMVSTQAQAADLKRGSEAGADAYLTKPFDPDELIELIESLLAPPA